MLTLQDEKKIQTALTLFPNLTSTKKTLHCWVKVFQRLTLRSFKCLSQCFERTFWDIILPFFQDKHIMLVVMSCILSWFVFTVLPASRVEEDRLRSGTRSPPVRHRTRCVVRSPHLHTERKLFAACQQTCHSYPFYCFAFPFFFSLSFVVKRNSFLVAEHQHVRTTGSSQLLAAISPSSLFLM